MLLALLLRADPKLLRAASAARAFEDLGCAVEQVDNVFERDPADLWTAEFYAGVGTRLRPFVETQRDLLDPAVAEVLDAALSQDMRDYYWRSSCFRYDRDSNNPWRRRRDTGKR